MIIVNFISQCYACIKDIFLFTNNDIISGFADMLVDPHWKLMITIAIRTFDNILEVILLFRMIFMVFGSRKWKLLIEDWDKWFFIDWKCELSTNED